MVKTEYPDLTENQISDIAFAPWRFAKEQMEHGELPEIRLKYFGTFRVLKGRAKYQLRDLKNMFELNRINHTQYFKLKEMIEKFLKREDGKI